jgi:hypothetical protein
MKRRRHSPKQIAAALTDEGIPSPSAHDTKRNSHRPGHSWAMSAVRAILVNPRCLSYRVSGRTKKKDMLDPDVPALGYVNRRQWQQRDGWVTSTVHAYKAIVEEQIRVCASEWGELALILGGTPENSVVGRSRKQAPDPWCCRQVPHCPGDR